MKSFSTLLFMAFAVASAQGCNNIYGNTYCKEVDHISYQGIQNAGTYQDVVSMDPKTCKVQHAPKAYGGSLAPLDEGLSVHFRGPINLKQFAVYYPDGGKKGKGEKKGKKDNGHGYRHGGSVVNKSYHKRAFSGYKRAAYYNAEQGVAKGLVFMNHMGGQKSGVWDTCWGNSISYASDDCDGASHKPKVLKNRVLKSNKEFMIFSDDKCDESCGYSRPGIPAYKGFSGKDKVFLFEFSMPKDDSPGVPNNNMPAVWLLNSKIPRTAQYNEISCWKSGCGELDVFEVLEQGYDYVKSHFHASQGGSGNTGGGGSPDYFKRPYGSTMKAAVIMKPEGTADIMILDKSYEFGEKIDPTTCKAKGPASVFNVPKSIKY